MLSFVNCSITQANLAINHFHSSCDEPKMGHCLCCTTQYYNVRTDRYFRIFMVCFDFENVQNVYYAYFLFNGVFPSIETLPQSVRTKHEPHAVVSTRRLSLDTLLLTLLAHYVKANNTQHTCYTRRPNKKGKQNADE